MGSYFASKAIFPAERLVALLAAAFVALSWEFGYHARFLAVDAILTQFVALELWMFLRAWNATLFPRAATMDTFVASAAAACALACKSTAIFAVLPLVALAASSDWASKARRLRGRERAMAAVLQASSCSSLSPGVFIDPLRFWDAMALERINYSED